MTLTTTVAYLSLATHRQIRLNQALALRYQARLLDDIVDPPPVSALPTPRVVRAGLLETGKDRWNREISSLALRLQTTDWHAVRQGLEDRVTSLYKRARDNVS